MTSGRDGGVSGWGWGGVMKEMVVFCVFFVVVVGGGGMGRGDGARTQRWQRVMGVRWGAAVV